MSRPGVDVKPEDGAAPMHFIHRARRPGPRAGLSLAGVVALVAVTTTPAVSQDTIAITGATLWDGTGRAPVADAVVLVRGERIACVGSRRECPVPRGARAVPADGRWLVPGLIDSHVHLLLVGRDREPVGLTEELRHLLAQGITTVRDMGTNPALLLQHARAAAAGPRVFAMQLVAGHRFFYLREQVELPDGSTGWRQPPAQAMQSLGWTPFIYFSGDDPDSLVARAIQTGASGLKLYADLDTAEVRALAAAAHRAGLTVWGHAWVQPASALEQVRAGQDGVVHAAGLVGELFGPLARDSLLGGTALLAATAGAATLESARDPRVLGALDTMVRHGTVFEPTLDVTLHRVAHFATLQPHQPTLPEAYARAAGQFGMEVTREAWRRGVRITAGTDHVAYGAPAERATLAGELGLLVDSVGMSPAEALGAATRVAAQALGGDAARELGTIEAGRYADLVLLRRDPLTDIRNVDAVEWVMAGGRLFRPAELRAGGAP